MPNSHSGFKLLGSIDGNVQTITNLDSLTFSPLAAKTISLGRDNDDAGNPLSIQAGDAASGVTNKAGGVLNLNSGMGTGNSINKINLQVYYPGSSGITDQTLGTDAIFWKNSATQFCLSLNNTTIGSYSSGITLNGATSETIGLARHTTTNTAGAFLTIQAGGATSGSTDKNGGTLLLKSGISTGTGLSQIILQTATPDSTGTSDNSFATRLTIDSAEALFTTKVTAPTIKLTTGAGAGKVLTSDANGDATWEVGGSSDGWITAGETWEYVSVDDPTGIFRINADVTGKYSAGMRIKFTNGGNIIYGIITVVGAYTGGYTSITFLHQIDPTDSLALYLMANSAITLNYYSTQKVPFGFPIETNKWTVKFTATSDITTNTPTQNVWYNCYSLSIPIGSWNVGWGGVIGIVSAASKTGVRISGTLSTANNSEVDTELSAYQGLSGAAGTLVCIAMVSIVPKNISITTKATYYFNYRTITTAADVASLVTAYVNAPIIIKAICAYL